MDPVYLQIFICTSLWRAVCFKINYIYRLAHSSSSHILPYISDLYGWVISISWISCESLIPYFISFTDLSISYLLHSIGCVPDIRSVVLVYRSVVSLTDSISCTDLSISCVPNISISCVPNIRSVVSLIFDQLCP